MLRTWGVGPGLGDSSTHERIDDRSEACSPERLHELVPNADNLANQAEIHRRLSIVSRPRWPSPGLDQPTADAAEAHRIQPHTQRRSDHLEADLASERLLHHGAKSARR